MNMNTLVVGKCDGSQVTVNRITETVDGNELARFEVLYNPVDCADNSPAFDASDLSTFSSQTRITFDAKTTSGG